MDQLGAASGTAGSEEQRRLAAVRLQEMNLRKALASRADIDHAVGMIMLARGCDADAAWTRLRRASQHANVKVRLLCATMARLVAGTDPALLDPAAHHAVWEALGPSAIVRGGRSRARSDDES